MTAASPPHSGTGSCHRAPQAGSLHPVDNHRDIVLSNICEGAVPLLDRPVVETDVLLTAQDTRQDQRIISVTPFSSGNMAQYRQINPVRDLQTRGFAFSLTESGYYLDNRQTLPAPRPHIRPDVIGSTYRLYDVLAGVLPQSNSDNVTILHCDSLPHVYYGDAPDADQQHPRMLIYSDAPVRFMAGSSLFEPLSTGTNVSLRLEITVAHRHRGTKHPLPVKDQGVSYVPRH